MGERLSDDEIARRWLEAFRLYHRGTSFGQKIGLMLADKLEADGATEADIDRLFVLWRKSDV